jgi:Microcystin-dependent protein
MDTSSFIGEIRAFPYNFAPEGWLLCDGSQVNLMTYQALFAVIGNFYGNTDSRTYFTLPNLQGMVPMGANSANPQKRIGQKGGNETVTITNSNMPIHNHTAFADKRDTTQLTLVTNTPSPTVFLSNMLGTTTDGKTPSVYSYVDVTPQTTNIVPNAALIGASAGNGLSHNNMMPYLPFRLCICWNGVFPTQD